MIFRRILERLFASWPQLADSQCTFLCTINGATAAEVFNNFKRQHRFPRISTARYGIWIGQSKYEEANVASGHEADRQLALVILPHRGRK